MSVTNIQTNIRSSVFPEPQETAWALRKGDIYKDQLTGDHGISKCITRSSAENVRRTRGCAVRLSDGLAFKH